MAPLSLTSELGELKSELEIVKSELGIAGLIEDMTELRELIRKAKEDLGTTSGTKTIPKDNTKWYIQKCLQVDPLLSEFIYLLIGLCLAMYILI